MFMIVYFHFLHNSYKIVYLEVNYTLMMTLLPTSNSVKGEQQNRKSFPERRDYRKSIYRYFSFPGVLYTFVEPFRLLSQFFSLFLFSFSFYQFLSAFAETSSYLLARKEKTLHISFTLEGLCVIWIERNGFLISKFICISVCSSF